MDLFLFLVFYFIGAILLAVLTVGTGFTLLYCALRIMGNKEQLTPKKMCDILMGV
jgi:hypothetical protein